MPSGIAVGGQPPKRGGAEGVQPEVHLGRAVTSALAVTRRFVSPVATVNGEGPERYKGWNRPQIISAQGILAPLSHPLPWCLPTVSTVSVKGHTSRHDPLQRLSEGAAVTLTRGAAAWGVSVFATATSVSRVRSSTPAAVIHAGRVPHDGARLAPRS